MPSPLTVSFVRCAADTQVRALPFADWADFAACLSESVRDEIRPRRVDRKGKQVDGKTALPMIVPATFATPYRRSANVDAITAVVLDLDNLPSVDFERLLEIEIPGQILQAVVYTSPSDEGPGAPMRKCRVILGLDGPLPPAYAGPARQWAAELLGVQVDASTLDPARGFFVGRYDDTPEREFRSFDGKPLCALDLINRLPAPSEQGKSATREVEIDAEPVLTDEQHAELIAHLEPHWVLGQRHHMAWAVGNWLAQRGLSAADIVAVVEELPSADPGARVRDALAGASAEQGGWHGLRTMMGDTAAEAMADATPNPRLEVDQVGGDLVGASIAREGERRLAATAKAEPPKHRAFRCVDDLYQEPVAELVANLGIARGCVTGLLAECNCSKTPLACLLALSLQWGVPFLGHETVQTPTAVLWLEKYRTAQERYLTLAEGHALDTRGVRRLVLDRETLVEREFGVVRTRRAVLDELVADLTERRIGCLIIDTYNAAVAGLDANNAQIAVLLRDLQEALPDVAIVALLHTTKSAAKAGEPPSLFDIRGSGALAGALDSAIGLHRPDTSREHLYQVTCVRSLNGDGFAPFAIAAKMLSARAWRIDLVSPGQQAELAAATEARAKPERRVPAAERRAIDELRAEQAADRLVQVGRQWVAAHPAQEGQDPRTGDYVRPPQSWGAVQKALRVREATAQAGRTIAVERGYARLVTAAGEIYRHRRGGAPIYLAWDSEALARAGSDAEVAVKAGSQ